MEGITGESQRTTCAAELSGAVTALSRLSQVANSRCTPEEALGLSASTVAALLRVDKVAVLVLDQDSDTLRLAAEYGLPKLVSRVGKAIGEELTRHCMRTLAPVSISDTSADGQPGAKQLMRRGIASALCTPLYVGERAYGAILAMSGAPRAFTVPETQLLQTIANQSALALWKAQTPEAADIRPVGGTAVSYTEAELIRIANRKIEELGIVNRVSQAVVSTLDLDKLLNIVLEESMAAVGAGAGSLMLVGEDGMMRIVVSRGLHKSVVESVHVRLGEGIAGRVAQQGKPALLSKGREREFAEVALRPDVTSSMSVPLYTGAEVIGVLNVSTVSPNKEFTERDLELLSTLANQMAMAINNARLHESVQKQASELAALLEIAHTVNATLELDEVLRRVTREIGRLMEVGVCAILLLDEVSGRWRFGAGHGLTKLAKRRSLKWAYTDLVQPCAAEMLKEGQAVLFDDIQAEGCSCVSDVALEAGLHAMLCTPFRVKGGVIGAAAVFSKRPAAFSRQEVEVLTALGELGGTAIHNARIYQHKYRIASLTQNDLTPKLRLEQDGLEVGHRFFAAREVGGDYYDLFSVGPGKLGVVMADVAGSSVAAAAYTSMTRNVLRAYAREHGSPSVVLAKLNRVLNEDTAVELFVSLFYGVLDLRAGEMTYCLAGHEPPLLYRPSSGRFRLLRADGILVGILPDARFEEKKLKLRSGDLLVVFTDGLTETKAGRQRFGLERIRQAIAADALKPAQQAADNMYARLLGFSGNRVQDDVALLVLRIR